MKNSSGAGGFNLKSGCLVVIGLAVVCYLALSMIQCIQESRGEAPDLNTAPYIITTPSRVYLTVSGIITDSADNIKKLEVIVGTYSLKSGEKLVMNDWYDQNKEGKWKLNNGESPVFTLAAYGEISITKRVELKEMK